MASAREEIPLQGPGRAVYLPPMVWGVQFNFSPDAVLLVLASDQYQPGRLHSRLRRVPARTAQWATIVQDPWSPNRS